MSQAPQKPPLPPNPVAYANTRPEALKVYDVPWEDADIQALRDYLLRNPRFLVYLGCRVPKIDGETMEQVALSGKKHDGFEECFSIIQSMTDRPVDNEKSPYDEGGELKGDL